MRRLLPSHALLQTVVGRSPKCLLTRLRPRSDRGVRGGMKPLSLTQAPAWPSGGGDAASYLSVAGTRGLARGRHQGRAACDSGLGALAHRCFYIARCSRAHHSHCGVSSPSGLRWAGDRRWPSLDSVVAGVAAVLSGWPRDPRSGSALRRGQCDAQLLAARAWALQLCSP